MEQNKYVVKVMNLFSNLIEVEAENEQEAKEKAKDIVTNKEKEEDVALHYEATLPEEYWGILSKEDFDRLLEEQKNQEDNKL
jgi:hypothetical protein